MALFIIRKYDMVFIHREASPVGPPVFEWIISRLLKRKIIYDFDDAIWIPHNTNRQPVLNWLKHSSKIASICKLSDRISVGNEFLYEYARANNRNVRIVPTTIDTVHVHNRIKNQFTDEVVLGWTGSHSTLKYLNDIIPILKDIEGKCNFKFLVIADRKPVFQLDSLIHIKWDKQSEIEDLLKINIGLMPLPETEWAKGKCGLKALQYMAMGIPALVSPVGVNSQIVDPGHNGYLCASPSDWCLNIEKLIKQPELRNILGKNGRQTVEKFYSVGSNKANFLELFSK